MNGTRHEKYYCMDKVGEDWPDVELFEEMGLKNVVPWTTIICGFVKSWATDEARRLSDEMIERKVFLGLV